MSDKSRCLSCRYPRPDASVKLYCFPWAGGGANFYSNWGKFLPETIEVHGVCLAGREARFSEPVYEMVEHLLDDITAAISVSCKGKPFALWGHSLGALLTYEAACHLKSKYNMEPVHIFLSGASAPHSEKRKQSTVNVKGYTDEEFIGLLKHFGGTPTDIIENRELMSLFLPPLRADYELLPQISTKSPPERRVFSCTVDVFDGKDDSEHDLQAWKDISTGPFSITMFDGGHFYLKEEANMKKLCNYVSDALIGCPL
ncbi:S-acyl fatty acid synthase thioesterase, medium chain-like [Mercenaria mercenaria]|uniref:S-acyl fatty acid synthase thioesterase, medium chain-like n=1 Tax=Mercenaria mercenaria TaxID=6596 RepID=UPI00234FA0C8|nr:S-acyl fatty acid synthase thioesterase, medium chain-like [Mercenaria mercenaria]XP_053399948.1 S-acyl fatty acid synthase thioesterase, medium chain-like [Mercenaria mercenaria]XP_053399949.1 S-acyl fatty acid synthase thioesterase, medium chain-like [Mercenaria mercenaria]